MKKSWLDFGDLDPIFKVTQGLKIVGKWLVCTLSYEGMAGFWPNLHNYIVVTWKKLIRFWWPWPIFKVTGGLRLLENDFSAPFLQNERMLFTKLVQLYCWDRDKKWLDFGNLDPIFKDTGGSDCWKMACLHPISRMNLRILTQLVHLYCCDMEKKNWSDFGDLDSIFKVTQGLRLLKNGLSAPYNEGMDGFWPNLQYYIVVTWKKKTDQILMTLTPFSRSQEGSDCWKMAFLHIISRMNGWILAKLVQLYCWDRNKNWLDFGDLDPIRFWWPWPLLDFGDLDPIFKVTLGQILENGPIDRMHTQKKINYRFNLFQW